MSSTATVGRKKSVHVTMPMLELSRRLRARNLSWEAIARVLEEIYGVAPSGRTLHKHVGGTGTFKEHKPGVAGVAERRPFAAAAPDSPTR